MKTPYTLSEKIEYAINLMQKAEKLALKYDGKDGFFLAFSGGKDSQCLYHLALMAGVKFKAHMNMTSIDPPEVIKFIKETYPDVILHPPKKSIYKYAIEKQILPSMKIRWCCAELKEMAGAGKVTLIGIRKSESARRAKRNEVEVSNHKFSGDLDTFHDWQISKIKKQYPNINQDQFSHRVEHGFRCINGKDSIIVSPILHWTERDVWTFLDKICKVQHCSLYDKGYKRIGCILCPMSNIKQKLKEMADYPHVKKNWIKAIKSIRNGGVYQGKLTQRGDSSSTQTIHIGRENTGLWGGVFRRLIC